METKKKLHSEEYLNDARNYWWNPDYLNLTAQRFSLHNKKLMLDVGCGVGHWSLILSSFLHPDALIIGVDQEMEWVKKCQEQNFPRAAQFLQADANHLPFPDGHFDMVTCQTVLMHVKDAQVTLQEFQRVLKPGGLLLVAEPNVLAASIVNSSAPLSLEESLGLFKLEMYCNAGKTLLGEGNNEVGDLIPGYLAQLGFDNIRAFQNDRPHPWIPPYNTVEEKVLLSSVLAKATSSEESYTYSQADTLRYFLAAGGNEIEFPQLWKIAIDSVKNFKEQLQSGHFHTAGGLIFYLIGAEKQSLKKNKNGI